MPLNSLPVALDRGHRRLQEYAGITAYPSHTLGKYLAYPSHTLGKYLAYP